MIKYSIKCWLTVCALWLAIGSLITAPADAFAPYPKPESGYISDFVQLLSQDRHEEIEQWLWQVESRTGIEIIVITIQSLSQYPGTANSSIEQFAKEIFDQYGIGNLPQNNGILFLISLEDRKARIELGAGYGHRRDQDAQEVMQSVIVPAFKNGDYDRGIRDGVEAIVLEFAGLRVGYPWNTIVVSAIALASILVGVSLYRNGRRGWGYVVVGFAIVLGLLAAWMFLSVFRHMADSDSDDWGSGGSGGFGGGSSGGGGATGEW